MRASASLSTYFLYRFLMWCTSLINQVDVWGWHRVNNNVAIWSRENKDISEEEYQKFYKAISKETIDAQSWIHFKAEGEVSKSLSISVAACKQLLELSWMLTPW